MILLLRKKRIGQSFANKYLAQIQNRFLKYQLTFKLYIHIVALATTVEQIADVTG